MSRILSIVRKRVTNERLYNLAVADDESYIADGIIVHNCKSYYSPQLKGDKTNKDLTKKDKAWSGKVGKAEPSMTLAEDNTKTVIQAIQVSKKLAISWADAERLALEFAPVAGMREESDQAYRLVFKDPGLFVEGSLRTFEPMEGVILFMGYLKEAPLAMAEGAWDLQTVVVSKQSAKSLAQAKKLAKELGAQSVEKVDETEDSFRFRQQDPESFSAFRTKKVEAKGVSLVYGKRK